MSVMYDDLAKTNKMAKQKFRTTRRSGFSMAKAYMLYVEVSKKCCNAVGRTFCNAIMRSYLVIIVFIKYAATSGLQWGDVQP